MYTPRTIAQTFYAEILGKFNFELAHQLIAEDYIQHNPQLKTGREGVLEAISFLKTLPPKPSAASPIQLIFEEGPFAVVFLLLEMGGQPKAIMDLFRVEDGQLAEHWDCIQDLDRRWEVKAFPSPENFPPDSGSRKAHVQKLFESLSHEKGELDPSIFHPDVSLYAAKTSGGAGKGETFLAELHSPSQYTFHRIIEAGPFVFVQSTAVQGGKSFVWNDLLEWEQDRIKRWVHLAQEIPAQMRHGNGMV